MSFLVHETCDMYLKLVYCIPGNNMFRLSPCLRECHPRACLSRTIEFSFLQLLYDSPKKFHDTFHDTDDRTMNSRHNSTCRGMCRPCGIPGLEEEWQEDFGPCLWGGRECEDPVLSILVPLSHGHGLHIIPKTGLPQYVIGMCHVLPNPLSKWVGGVSQFRRC